MEQAKTGRKKKKIFRKISKMQDEEKMMGSRESKMMGKRRNKMMGKRGNKMMGKRGNKKIESKKK